MGAEYEKDAALTGIRVLDLTTMKGHLCGKLLADLGAEVIKVEEPRGDAARFRGPFRGDEDNPEKSLYFIYFNTNKKGIVLDLDDGEDRGRFSKLIETADVVLESFQPGVMAGWRLDYPLLKDINPGIVMTSITGFGQTGPHSQYKAPDAVAFAMGGVMNLCGDPDKAPLAMPNELTFHLASVYAAYGTMLALYNRMFTGVGQHVDVSAQEVQASQLYMVVNYGAIENLLSRAGGRSPRAGTAPHGPYPCKDGYAYFFVMNPRHWQGLFKWMGEPEIFSDPIWENRHFRGQNLDVLTPYVEEFSAQYTRRELTEEGQARRIPIVPVNSPDDFVMDTHTLARGFFIENEHPEIGKFQCPGAPYIFSETPCRIRRPSPLLGQHSLEVLSESVRELTRDSNGPILSGGRGRKLALEGVRVVDLGMAIAGPFLAKLLAEHGAEVIRVESSSHQQRGRAFHDPRVQMQQRVVYADNNRCKKAVTINLGTEKGQDVLRRLVLESDVLVENFSPRVMKKWNLDYAHLKEVKEDIILVSLPAFGLAGPRSQYLGAAGPAMAFAGLYHLWSYPNGTEPAAPTSTYPDYLAASLGALAVTAALRHRALTGKGQHVEVAQVEGIAAVLGPTYLDFTVNGRVEEPIGNWSSYAAPHGCYRCAGEDRWCVIAVQTEEEWEALCRVMGDPTWTRNPKFAGVRSRLHNREELDANIEGWTREYTPFQVMRMLQKAGVPAGVVQNGEDLFYDSHLRQRGYFVEIDHPETGKVDYPGPTVRLSETPARVGRWARVGEHNAEVFEGLLGMTKLEIAELVEEGVLV